MSELSVAPYRISTAHQNWYRFSRNPTAVIGSAIVLIVLLAALFAPWIAPHPDHVGAIVNFRARHSPPSLDYWFGTDNVGRDIFSRVLFGYRISLMLAVVVLGIAVPFGVTLGLVAGYFGGWAEIVIMRLTDIALAIPPLVMALAVTAVLTPNLIHAMLAIAVLWWTWHTRLIFSITRTLRHQEFVEAAETLGAQLRLGDLRQSVARFRLRHPDRRGALLPRPWRAAADARPRHDGGDRRRLPARPLVGIAAAGRGHPVRRARVQPARRRPSRSL
jgi:ABC-type dipeptide/oligopeptide/nickel transport system permease subunit